MKEDYRELTALAGQNGYWIGTDEGMLDVAFSQGGRPDQAIRVAFDPAGVKYALNWLRERVDGPALSRCPYCGQMHESRQVEMCPLNKNR